MEPLTIPLFAAVTLIPVFYVLWYFGIAVTRVGFSWFRASLSLPARWEGKLSGSSGLMRRNFVILKGCSTLSIEIVSISGAMAFEINAPDGSVLSPASGSYGRDAALLFDVSHLKRCSVTLYVEDFNGSFRITLT